jgi:hypothetical protein
MKSRTFFRTYKLIVDDTLFTKKHRSTILRIDKKFRNYAMNFRNNNSFNRTILELRQIIVRVVKSLDYLLIELY